MSFTLIDSSQFSQLCGNLFNDLKSGESLTINLDSENSDYLRWTQGKIRQNTSLNQMILSLQFQAKNRTLTRQLTLSGHQENDLKKAREALNGVRTEADLISEDPHQIPMVNNGQSEKIYSGQWPSTQDLCQKISETTKTSDFAGLSCFGTVVVANQNSAGQKHWFSTDSFFIDYSLYHGPRAAKGVYAGAYWKDEDWEKQFRKTQKFLDELDKPLQKIKPGSYRTYLAPAAVSELVSLISWGGVSASAWKQGRCALKKLADGEKNFSPLFNLRENFDLGLAPQFNSLGEVSPLQVSLIEEGRFKQFLTSSRTAKEHRLEANGADSEMLRSPEILPGNLHESDIFKKLETGLYLSNLHYLNWSDLATARVTGMTRYACFWVEKGEIVGPIQDLRFDESLYNAFGENLIGLTKQTEVDPQVMTYSMRAIGGKQTPGALINNFSFTL